MATTVSVTAGNSGWRTNGRRSHPAATSVNTANIRCSPRDRPEFCTLCPNYGFNTPIDRNLRSKEFQQQQPRDEQEYDGQWPREHEPVKEADLHVQT